MFQYICHVFGLKLYGVPFLTFQYCKGNNCSSSCWRGFVPAKQLNILSLKKKMNKCCMSKLLLVFPLSSLSRRPPLKTVVISYSTTIYIESDIFAHTLNNMTCRQNMIQCDCYWTNTQLMSKTLIPRCNYRPHHAQPCDLGFMYRPISCYNQGVSNWIRNSPVKIATIHEVEFVSYLDKISPMKLHYWVKHSFR